MAKCLWVSARFGHFSVCVCAGFFLSCSLFLFFFFFFSVVMVSEWEREWNLTDKLFVEHRCCYVAKWYAIRRLRDNKSDEGEWVDGVWVAGICLPFYIWYQTDTQFSVNFGTDIAKGKLQQQRPKVATKPFSLSQNLTSLVNTHSVHF